MPGIAIDAQILAPFIHRRVPYHVGSPHVAVYIVAGIAALRPVHGIEGRQGYGRPTLLNGSNGRRDEGHVIAGIVVCALLPGERGRCPVLHICGIGASAVGAEDVIPSAALVVDHRRVVYAHLLLCLVSIQRFGFRISQLCLRRCGQRDGGGKQKHMFQFDVCHRLW